MRKKYLSLPAGQARLIAIAFVLIAAGVGIYWLTAKSQKNFAATETAKNVQVVNADNIVSNPEKFMNESGTGNNLVHVKGTVTNIDKPNSVFTLGCEDACIGMPVKFSGQPPKEGTNVIVYGNVMKNPDGKFFFDAKEIKLAYPAGRYK